MKKALLPITTFARIDTKRLFRDKVAIFFVFIFPVMFLLIFGSIFSGDNNISFKVALLAESNNQFTTSFVDEIKNNDVFDVDEKITSLDAAKEKMNRGTLDAVIILPATFGDVGQAGYPTGQATVLYDQTSTQAGQTLASIMQSIFTEINAKFVTTKTPFTVKTESTATKGLTQFDYTFAGLLGFTMLSLGVFGPTSVFPRLKQKGVLRRYRTTTLKVWQYFVANVLSNGFTGVLSVGLMFVVAIVVFDLQMRCDYLSFLIMILLGATLMFGIGLAIGGWAKNENQAAPLAQMVALPMMFLSGVFFPTFLMPEFLQRITQFIPLTPVVDGFRMIVTEGMTIFEIGPQVALILIWTVIIYAIAFKVFRWE
jgi:ABC-2 type transport system permease protein